MIRVGIVDCDTSHVVQFTRRLNHVDIEEEQWVDGAQVVAAYPGTSAVVEQSRVDEYVAELCKYGVEIVDKPEDLLPLAVRDLSFLGPWLPEPSQLMSGGGSAVPKERLTEVFNPIPDEERILDL